MHYRATQARGPLRPQRGIIYFHFNRIIIIIAVAFLLTVAVSLASDAGNPQQIDDGSEVTNNRIESSPFRIVSLFLGLILILAISIQFRV